MICEARPNVTADIFSLCLRTGNACVLKGGSDARRSNEAIAALLHEALRSEGIDPAAFTLLPSDHEAVAALLGAVGYVDVVIPPRRCRADPLRARKRPHSRHRDRRGHRPHLFRRGRRPGERPRRDLQRQDAARERLQRPRLPQSSTAAASGSWPNCATRWPPHGSRSTPTQRLTPPSRAATPPACSALPGSISAPSSSTTNWRSKPSVRLTKPWPHRTLPSRHSEAIVTENAETARLFTQRTDAACVYVNVSTAFTDGGQFRIRRRGRNLDPETPRPGPDGAPRTHDLQVRRFGRRADPDS